MLRPQLLLLDEPHLGAGRLDPATSAHLLRDAQQRYGVAYSFISHDLAVIRAMAHDVLVLRHGQVVESGPAEQLFTARRRSTPALLAAARVGDGKRVYPLHITALFSLALQPAIHFPNKLSSCASSVASSVLVRSMQVVHVLANALSISARPSALSCTSTLRASAG